MAEQHQYGDCEGCENPRRVGHKKQCGKGGGGCGDQRGKGGYFEAECHHKPNQRADQGSCRRECQKHAQCRCHAFAALKSEKHLATYARPARRVRRRRLRCRINRAVLEARVQAKRQPNLWRHRPRASARPAFFLPLRKTLVAPGLPDP